MYPALHFLEPDLDNKGAEGGMRDRNAGKNAKGKRLNWPRIWDIFIVSFMLKISRLASKHGNCFCLHTLFLLPFVLESIF